MNKQQRKKSIQLQSCNENYSSSSSFVGWNLVLHRKLRGRCNPALWLYLKVFLSFWKIFKVFAMSLRLFAPEKFTKPFHLAAPVPLRKDIVPSIVNFIEVLSANHSSGEIDCILSKRKRTLGHLKRPLHLQRYAFSYIPDVLYITTLFSSFHWSELTKNACFNRSAGLKWQILSYVVYKNSTNPTKSDTTTVAIEKFKDTEFISSVRQTDLREIHW